ncbi:DUF6907 domain-containing protein [Actinacidiphila guanduensis]|uniref:Uncharacterized protein n=1 Tax=Actinacidiphila guanduensis TaxID=310781 RepID=A0A1H0K7T3_9ACTN|nr:hypothetical protein [Actinacidiphila guanduensis]SDO51832.1 hypothetical protein SAMN05216259_110141 [Actinacidiphila guanduensis]
MSRTWTITTDTGFSISGHLPDWAEEDPSAQGVPIERLGLMLSDINHHRGFVGCPLPVHVPDGRTGTATESVEVLHVGIDCDPYAPEPELRQPVANLCLVDDYMVPGLDPDGLARLAAALRAHADLLDGEVRAALVRARGDWADSRSYVPA